MSETCENNTKLQRDGTSRQQRLLDALLPDYVSIDGRKMKDLIGFVQNFAEEINYFNEDNEKAGDWKEFFGSEADKDLQEILFNDEQSDEANFLEYVKEKSGYTQPHIALFLAFLKLFEIARDDLNQITKKHLDHYYKDVLQLDKQPAVSDQVFLIFSLARHVDSAHLIKKGTALKAGKDETGQPLTYETNRDLTINHGKADQIKALFVDREKDYRLYASPDAKSSDGEGAEIESEDMSWKTFGGRDRKQAEIGFSIASPLLHLAEGNRTVCVTLQFAKTPESRTILQELADDWLPFDRKVFNVLFSGEEEWIVPKDEEMMNLEEEIHPDVAQSILEFVNTESAEAIATKVKDDPTRGYETVRPGYAIGMKVAKAIVTMREDKGSFKDVNDLRKVFGLGADKIQDLIYTFRKPIHATRVSPEDCTIKLLRTLDESQPPVVAYNQEALEEPIQTKWPAMKALLNRKELEGDGSGKKFPHEYLQDLKLESVVLNVDVAGVKTNVIQNDSGPLDPGKPFQPFGNRPVIGSSFYIGNWEIFQKELDKFWVKVKWHDLPEESFGVHYDNYINDSNSRENSSFKVDIAILNDRKWQAVDKGVKLFELQSGDEEEEEPVKSDRTICFFRDQFGNVVRNPDMRAVSLYGTDTQRGFIRLTLRNADFGHKDYAPSFSQAVMATSLPGSPVLPNEPYTPLISELSLDYRSSAKLKLAAPQTDDQKKKFEQYFHVNPFGITPIDPAPEDRQFLPVYKAEGTLYIGVRNFTGGQNISLLFKVSEGSADPDFLQQPVTWSYLAGDKWEDFSDRDILSDSTNQLLTSGIIHFSVPKKASTSHSLLPDGLVWLRATVDRDTPAVSDLIDIRAQAVTATFKDNQNDPEHLAEPLEAETISKLKESDSAVQEVLQPYASFGGSVQEKSHTFYTRVSERLRHKHRAITIWDYERLILQKFPSVYKVKCLNHTLFKGSLKEYSEIAPGCVSLIVVSDMINQTAVDPLKPKTSLTTLTEIHEYLECLMAESVSLYVRNPLYEEIRVEFNVKFREGRDAGYYQGVLNKEIKSYLSPWAFQTTPDVVFGGRIHKSKILHFIERRDYVDFVTCFKMEHIVPTEPGKDPIVQELDEAETTTTASVLGSAPEHIIHVLDAEESACDDCDDNEVSAFKELEVDECGC